MSGVVSTVMQAAGALSAVNQIANFLTGGGPIVLGSFVFQDFAIPEVVRRGVSQQMTVHKFPGGARWIDLMGPDPEPIEWTGTFLGADAEAQAREIEALTEAGEVLPLSIGDFSTDVVIRNFDPKYAYHRITYTISCIVIPPEKTEVADAETSVLDDLSSGLAGVQGAITTAQKVVSTGAQVAGALGVSIPGLQSVQGALATANGLAVGAGGLVAGSAKVVSTLGAVQAAGATISTNIDAIGATVPSLFNGTADSLNAVAVQSGAMAALTQVRGVVGRAAQNIQFGGLF